MTTFRRSMGIVSGNGDPAVEADVIMTALALGFIAWCLGDPADAASGLKPLETGPVRFDAEAGSNDAAMRSLNDAVSRMGRAVAAYLKTDARVMAGRSGSWAEGACIMGVYGAVGQKAPDDIAILEYLSEEGSKRWEQIKKNEDLLQYTGRGAYTGFVDDPNGQVLAGPLSSARFWASNIEQSSAPERWLPPLHPTQEPWLRRVPNPTPENPKPSPFAWGLIGGNAAKAAPPEANAARITEEMEHKYHMAFNGMEGADNVDVAMYTHGMIQGIYLAYGHGPSCRAYEIATGTQTTKMASCLPCALFMSAIGYYPNSIHLGRGESWAPLFAPYFPQWGGTKTSIGNSALAAAIRDLNNSWYERCLLWLKKGLAILDLSQIAANHVAAREAVLAFVTEHDGDTTLGGRLVLDAVTIHDNEQDRILRTLKS